jgi:hypothetical protein
MLSQVCKIGFMSFNLLALDYNAVVLRSPSFYHLDDKYEEWLFISYRDVCLDFVRSRGA